MRNPDVPLMPGLRQPQRQKLGRQDKRERHALARNALCGKALPRHRMRLSRAAHVRKRRSHKQIPRAVRACARCNTPGRGHG